MGMLKGLPRIGHIEVFGLQIRLYRWRFHSRIGYGWETVRSRHETVPNWDSSGVEASRRDSVIPRIYLNADIGTSQGAGRHECGTGASEGVKDDSAFRGIALDKRTQDGSRFLRRGGVVSGILCPCQHVAPPPPAGGGFFSVA